MLSPTTLPMTNNTSKPRVNLRANHSNPQATLMVTPKRPIKANTNAPNVAIHTIFVTTAPMVNTTANKAAKPIINLFMCFLL